MQHETSHQARAAALAAQLTLEEKAALCGGADHWHIAGVPRLGLAPVCLTDGPHGVRLQNTAGTGAQLHKSAPATCFPPACTTACSFDESLLAQMGAAMAEECRALGVSVLLGPGANLKRSPLCGRNFEYFSEDPHLAGKCAAAMIRGTQSRGVGTSLKHFACNNQEAMRMVGDSCVDERALRELYLAAFETAVKEGQPATVMGSYNRVNGTYACENRRLLTDILRGEWGFDGLVVTDWGAMNDALAALRAGLDLQMPGPCPGEAAMLVAAVRDGRLDEAVLDAAAQRVVRLLLLGQANKGGDGSAADGVSVCDTAASTQSGGQTPSPAKAKNIADKPAADCAQPQTVQPTAPTYDTAAHHALAGKIAEESAVLLQNDGMLPLCAHDKILAVGGFFETPRYQGAGSSQIVPTRVTSARDAFSAVGVPFAYSEGFGCEELTPHAEKQNAALAAARAQDCKAVCVFAGLPESCESEGFDRDHLRLPEAQLALIDALCTVGKPVAVVLHCGGCVETPFAPRVNAVLLLQLGGQNVGTAAQRLLYGAANPCGKLAETWPLHLEDCASTSFFGGRQVQYRESLYIGYRWFDKAQLAVRWPFGHGLSYTSFAYSDLQLSPGKAALSEGEGADADTQVSFTVTNTGACAGSEIAQVYVSAPETKLFMPVRELRGFAKVCLQPGESRRVSVTLSPRAFSFYNVSAARWQVQTGAYHVAVGASSQALPLCAELPVQSDESVSVPDLHSAAPAYYAPKPGAFDGEAGKAAFEALWGGPLPHSAPALPYTRNSAVRDLQATWLGRRALWLVRVFGTKQLAEGAGGSGANGAVNVEKMLDGMLYDMPLRSLAMVSQKHLTPVRVDGLIDILNGHIGRGLRKLLRG